MASDRNERIARNEVSFRELNDRLDSDVHRGSTEPEFAGFVCECGDEDCDMTIRVALGAYAEVRQDDKLFIVVPGHEAPEAENVVDEREGYVVVRKHDDVEEIVERG